MKPLTSSASRRRADSFGKNPPRLAVVAFPPNLESRPVVAARESYGAQSGGWRGTPATRQIDRHPSVDMFSVASGCASLARVVCKRPCRARAVRVRRATRVAVRASSSEENAGETLDDDLPPPIKLTADQARIAALAFEVLYEKDPVEDLEEMLKDKERPGLRLKLQQAIEGALALPLVSSSAASSFLDDSR